MVEVFDYLLDNVKVIGLSGAAGSGKDYVAKTYFIDEYEFRNISLAWHFKIDCIAKGQADYDEVFNTKPPRVRRLLKILGTEQGRELWGENVWVNTVFSWMMLFHKDWGIDRFIIPDVRFPNELENVQRLGGKVYRVVSDKENRFLTEEAKDHVSEKALSDDMSVYDGIIYNYLGESTTATRPSLENQIKTIVEDMENARMA